MKYLLLIFFSLYLMNIERTESLFEKIENDIWFDDNAYAGQSILFFKTDKGETKAIRQIHGSGEPILRTEIQDVIIRNDSIFLLEGKSILSNTKIDKIIFTYDKENGLKRNGKKVLKKTMIWAYKDEPYLYEKIYLKSISEIDVENYLIHMDDRVYRLNWK